MARPVAILLAVLAASAPIAALTQGGLPSVLDATGVSQSHDQPGIHRSDDGRQVRVNEEALPAPTGWVLVTVSASQETAYDLTQWVQSNGTRSPGWGYATYEDGWLSVQAGGTHAAGASVQGRSAGCCPGAARSEAPFTARMTGSGTGGGGHLAAGESLTFGLLAANWTDRDTYRANITVAQGTLTVEEVRTAEGGVTAVDLVKRARRNGTGVRAAGGNWVSEPGEAHLRRDLPSGGLVALASSAEGDRRARVSMTLPNGTTVDNGDGRNVSFYAQGVAGAGAVEVSLTDLESPDRTERALEAARGEDEDGPGGFDHVYADAIVAQVPGLTPHLVVDRHRTGLPEIPRDDQALTVTDDALPGERGWFVKRVVADETATVQVRAVTELSGDEDGPRAYAPFQVHERAPYVFADGRDAPPVVAASHEGETVACCRPNGTNAPWGHGALSDASYDEVTLEAGEPIFVGLAAVGWGDSDRYEVVLRPEGEDPSADLRVEATSQGTEVAAVDLVDAAERNGTNAATLGQQVAGSEGDASWSTAVDGSGLLGIGYWFEGQEARGVLDVTLPNGTTLGNGDGRNVQGLVSGVVGSGSLSVELTDVKRPSLADRATSLEEAGYAEAQLLFADVDLPLVGLHVDRDSTED